MSIGSTCAGMCNTCADSPCARANTNCTPGAVQSPGMAQDVLEGRQAREAKSIENFRLELQSPAQSFRTNPQSRQDNDSCNDDPSAHACNADM